MFRNWPVSKKLYAGFALILLVLSGIVGFSFLTSISSSDRFSEYRQTARASVAYGEIAQHIIDARLQSMKYRATRDGTALEGVRRAVADIEQTLSRIEKFDLEDEERNLLTELDQQSHKYLAGFEAAVDLQGQRNDLVNGQFLPLGTDIRKQITEVMETAYRDNDIRAAFYSARVQQHLLLARIYGQEFLLVNNTSARERFAKEIESALSELDKLIAELENPKRRDLALASQKGLETLSSVFDKIAETIWNRNEIYAGQLDQIGPQITGLAQNKVADQVASQDTIGPQINAAFESQVQAVLVAGAMALMIGAGLAFLLSRSLSSGIQSMTRAMSRLANHDLETDIPGLDRGDEIGDMGRAVAVFKENAIERERLEVEAREQQAARQAVQRATEDAIERFKASADGIMKILVDDSASMQSSAANLDELSSTAKGRAQEASGSADSASTDMQTVAAATEELSSSIIEIGRQVTTATDVVRQASEKTRSSVDEMNSLAAAGEKVGTVVSLIQAIAEQTNLLALNATIEAARAGEAGRGFAVVAAEVKELADQTSRATGEISEQISGIQGATQRAVEGIRNVEKMSDQLNDVTATIAAAVEEQGASTQEISQTTGQASSSMQMLAGSVTEVSSAISVAGDTAQTVLGVSERLAAQAGSMEEAVRTFYEALRAGSGDETEEEVSQAAVS